MKKILKIFFFLLLLLSFPVLFLLDWHDDDVLHSVLDQIGGYRRLRLLQTMPIEDVNPFLSLLLFVVAYYYY